MGNTNQAMTDLKQANTLKPTAEAYYQQGLIEYNNGELTAAKTDLEKARTLRKDVGNMNYLLGLLYYNDKQYTLASECLEDYTINVQTNAEAFYYEALSEAKAGKTDAAAKSVKYLKFNKGSDPKYLYRIYEVYCAIGDRQNALNNLSLLIESPEGRPADYKERAALYQAMGREDLSKEDLLMVKRLQGVAACE